MSFNPNPLSNLPKFDYSCYDDIHKHAHFNSFQVMPYLKHRELNSNLNSRVVQHARYLDQKEDVEMEEISPEEYSSAQLHLEKESVHDMDLSCSSKEILLSNNESFYYRFRQHYNPSPLSSFIFKKSPKALKEYELDTCGSDKIFASLWISDHQVAFGTKSNQLMVYNVSNDEMKTIPNIHLPCSSENSQVDNVSMTLQDLQESIVEHSSLHNSFVHSYTNLSNLSSILQSFPASLDGSTIQLNSNSNTTSPSVPFHVHCSGIHALCMNPSKTLLAVGSGKPYDCIQIYSLPSFEPLAVLLGHQDMVFGVVWTCDTSLMSASRDKKVIYWELSPAHVVRQVDHVLVYKCVHSYQDKGKVRDLQIDPQTGMVASLSSDGFVKLWDSNQFRVTDFVPLYHTNELVCMTNDSVHHLFAVGSQSHITLIDPRSSSAVHTFESLDEGWGVRSLLIRDGLLLVGGGMGRLSFYDLYNQKYQGWTTESDQQMYHQTGSGWLHKDPIYLQHFRNMEIKNAIYTLTYQPYDSLNLFVGGGPLQLSLKGSYAGFWKC